MPVTINGSTGVTANVIPNDGSVTQAKLAAGVAGNGPAFSVYASAGQSISANTYTKISLNTKVFDTNTNFDTTNYRFTPTAAGYYQINGGIGLTSVNGIYAIIYKNGSAYCVGNSIGNVAAASLYNQSTVGCLVYLNGSSDYVELYALSGNNMTTAAGQTLTYFNGFLARAA